MSRETLESGSADPLDSPVDLPQRHAILDRAFESAPDANLLVDGAGRITMVNAQAEQLFGYARDELIGQPVEILIPQRFVGRHVSYRGGYMGAPRTRPMGGGVELFARRKDGGEIPVDIMLSPLKTDDATLALAVVRDISERKQVEEEARQAREMYLRELHHRIKNNLQVISSLLYLQSTHTVDPETLGILKESQSRVRSIALIHEKLYRSEELTRIDFPEYIRDLVSDLVRTYGVNSEAIAVRLSIESVTLGIDTAIPCGLIINELVSNVFKHAYPGDRTGEVRIDLCADGERRYVLRVADDGVGLPDGFVPGASTSLGLQLVNDLTRQLDGRLSVESGEGASFRIDFREVHYKERS